MKDTARSNIGSDFRDVLTFLERAAQAQGVCLPAESDSLFDQGVLDSFGLLECIAFLEQKFDTKIPDEDLVPGRFETIDKIREYLEGHVGH